MDHRFPKGALRGAMAGGAAGLAALALVGLPVAAQEAAERSAAGAYEGVVPGTAHTPPRHGAVQRNERRGDSKPILSWVGFEPRANGGSRFFIQLSRRVPYTTAASARRFEVLFPNTKVHLRNTRRPLDTRFFNTPARSARVERRGRNDLAVVLAMRAEATPTVSEGEGASGYHFVYLDFAPGDYAAPPGPVPSPDGAAPPAAPREGEGARFETEEPGYDPEERAPGTNIRVYQGGN